MRNSSRRAASENDRKREREKKRQSELEKFIFMLLEKSMKAALDEALNELFD